MVLYQVALDKDVHLWKRLTVANNNNIIRVIDTSKNSIAVIKYNVTELPTDFLIDAREKQVMLKNPGLQEIEEVLTRK
ncbi:MAG: hypothetical protein HC896_11015 [Bacteroidales bacterium]|nr:hypothetical protein [Bacteroidales bacterium]